MVGMQVKSKIKVIGTDNAFELDSENFQKKFLPR